MHDARGRGAAEDLRGLFSAGVPVVGVMASGILIRALAPMIGDKRAEPAVVALSEDGASAVPLLGGHRGANAMARRLAEAFGGHAAVTTAGDLRLGVALDAPPEGWVLENPEDAKAAMAGLLAGRAARLSGEADWLGSLGDRVAREGGPAWRPSGLREAGPDGARAGERAGGAAGRVAGRGCGTAGRVAGRSRRTAGCGARRGGGSAGGAGR